jgi:3D (Asp-Asp-Asp) domain-containing protein
MINNSMAQRAFFIGKVSKYLVSGALLAILIMPTNTKADTSPSVIPVDNSLASNASSIIATIGIQGVNNLSLPTIQAKLVWVTAYASVPDETDSTPFVTANGDYVHDGVIAANWLPFGTQVKIPALFGDKIFTVDDRMNQAWSQRADVWMPTVNAALNFGLQHAVMVVLDNPIQSSTLVAP